jgi:GNAT superfamily N-acetyltransferase
MDLLAALIKGILGAPVVAVRRAAQPVEVRRGEPDEVIDVRHRVLREGRPRETAVFDGDDDHETRHWVATHDDRVIGVVSVMRRDEPDAEPPPARWQLRGMAVLPEWQGHKVGAALLADVQTDVDAPMWCNARAGVVDFYGRHCWTAHGEPFDIEPIGPHRRMRWTS